MPAPISVRPLTGEERRQVQAPLRAADAVTDRYAHVVLLSPAGQRVAEVVRPPT